MAGTQINMESFGEFSLKRQPSMSKVDLVFISTIDPDQDTGSLNPFPQPFFHDIETCKNIALQKNNTTAELSQSIISGDYIAILVDLGDILKTEIDNKRKKIKEIHSTYSIRIETLRSYAASEGFEINRSSETDFWSFTESSLYMRKAGLIVMDNGNICAVWRDNDKNFIDIQFLGNQSAEYVIFKHRSTGKDISRVAGRDTLDGIKEQIRAFDFIEWMDDNE